MSWGWIEIFTDLSIFTIEWTGYSPPSDTPWNVKHINKEYISTFVTLFSNSWLSYRSLSFSPRNSVISFCWESICFINCSRSNLTESPLFKFVIQSFCSKGILNCWKRTYFKRSFYAENVKEQRDCFLDLFSPYWKLLIIDLSCNFLNLRNCTESVWLAFFHILKLYD